MKSSIALIVLAALALGCGTPEEARDAQAPDGAPTKSSGPANRAGAPEGASDAESYARQANENASKGEDMPENKAPDDGGRTSPTTGG